MQISEILNKKQPTLSFEVFPPKTTNNYESVSHSVMEIASLKPDFLSVTYGAGGGTSMFTVKLAKEVQEKYQVTSMAHLTCVSSTKEMVKEQLEKIHDMKIDNILALRGDFVEGMDKTQLQYRYASELIEEIVSDYSFCIGAACYPEGHPEAADLKQDIVHIKEKVDAGCSFLTTQMFFDNDIFYRYMELLEKAGVTVPIVAGIMPITSGSQVERTLKLSNAHLPKEFQQILEKYEGDEEGLYQAGLEYAVNQVRDLRKQGVLPIHIYTMNKPDIAKVFRENF